MHLRKLPDGSVRFSHIDPWELRTFRALPELADFSTDARAEQRLLPTPAVDEDLSPDLAMDWVEYVVPELREGFSKNLDTVMADLDRLILEAFPPPADNGSSDEETFEDTDDGDDDDEHEVHEENMEDQDARTGLPGEPDSEAPLSESSSSSGSGSLEDDLPSEPAEYYTLTVPPDHVEHWFRALNQARLVLSCRFNIDSEHVPDLPALLESGELEHWFQYELFARLQGWFVEAVLDPE